MIVILKYLCVRNFCDLFEVILSTASDRVEDNRLGCATTQRHAHAIE